jgi:lysophospholipase L1-like esterase
VLWPDHTVYSLSGTPKVLLLGDSITHGGGWLTLADGSHAPEVSYRYPLWKRLVDAGSNFDFIGSMTSAWNTDDVTQWPDYKGRAFDRDHEGHWGWPIDWIRDGNAESPDPNQRLSVWLGSYTPDIALICLGTNDGTWQGDNATNMVAEAESLIALLRADNPNVVVIWGQPQHPTQVLVDFRANIRAMAGRLSTETSPIVVVDSTPGWVFDQNAGNTHTLDSVHTNPAGDEKLAADWFSALAPFLPTN